MIGHLQEKRFLQEQVQFPRLQSYNKENVLRFCLFLDKKPHRASFDKTMRHSRDTPAQIMAASPPTSQPPQAHIHRYTHISAYDKASYPSC
ncbi:hypothetical protein ES703_117196 [subsurface metagenome]